MEPRTGISAFFFGKEPRTREEALKVINGDNWLQHEFWYLSNDYVNDKQAGLLKMINVGQALLGGGDPMMELTIEAADWLYQESSNEVRYI
jgi:hypothetical protein